MTEKFNPIVVFGEVLFDCFPDGQKILGGAPFNVAWHLQALGASPLFISRIGSDESGQEIINAMQSWGMDCSAMQIDAAHETGQVQVTFNGNEPEYEIVQNCAWDFIEAEQLPDLIDGSLLYYGSLVFRNALNRQCLSVFQTAALRFMDVNLRPPWWERNTVCSLIEQADWIKLNTEEMRSLQTEISHQQSNILLTKGSEGADMFVRGADVFSVNPKESQENQEIVDTVGAGDAFASIILLGIYREWPKTIMMKRAQQFASAICSNKGAINRNRAFYEVFIEEWGIN